MNANLPTDQSDAITAAIRWYRHTPTRPFLLTGPAGTGKTSIARTIADRCAPNRTMFLAPTGKAAQVLKTKGCDATTIHSAIYAPAGETRALIAELRAKAEAADHTGDTATADQLRQRITQLAAPRWKLRDHLKKTSDKPPTLLIVDEASMVGTKLAADIASFGIPTLALGDPYQLPPVAGTAGYPGPADAHLTTIHRYGESAPLLTLATAARRNTALPDWDGTAGRYNGAYQVQHLARFDQVIVGRNATRWAIINALRTAEGRQPGVPEPGDPIMVLRNDPTHDVVNGQQTRITNAAHVGADAWLVSTTDGNTWEIDARGLTGQHGQDAAKTDRGELVAVTFAHAITCHSAQGSQWPTVAVVDESGMARDNAARWLYTAATRASEQCIVLTRPPSDVPARVPTPRRPLNPVGSRLARAHQNSPLMRKANA